MQTARAFQSLSKDPKNKVGALVVAKDGRQFSMGYNGFPEGIEEDWGDDVKHDFVIHAEVNAIVNASFPVRGGTVYVTLEPCHKCLGLLINAGIREVVYDRPYLGSCDNKIAKKRLLTKIKIRKFEEK